MIRAISFDVGETLLRPYPSFGEVVASCCRNAGYELPIDAVPRVGSFADQFFGELRRRGEAFSTSVDQSRLAWTTLYRSFLGTVGVAVADVEPLVEQIYATFLDHQSYRLFDDAIPALVECRARGLRVGVISNWEAWLSDLLGSNGVAELIDFAAISGIVGHEKPDRRIFEAAIIAAAVPADEILHVGDSVASDVAGAAAAGLHPVLLDRFGRVDRPNVRRITSLLDLFNLPELQPSTTEN